MTTTHRSRGYRCWEQTDRHDADGQPQRTYTVECRATRAFVTWEYTEIDHIEATRLAYRLSRDEARRALRHWGLSPVRLAHGGALQGSHGVYAEHDANGEHICEHVTTDSVERYARRLDDAWRSRQRNKAEVQADPFAGIVPEGAPF